MKKALCLVLALIFCLPAAFARAGTFRALCVSVSAYDDGRQRLGGINSAQGVYDALSRAFGVGGSYTSTLMSDPSKQEFLDGIPVVFAEAGPLDVSLIYINAHGSIADGVSRIETREGGLITPRELEAVTRGIPGNVILLIDCCASGGFIGEGFARSFTRYFGQNSFLSDKYMVIVSCGADEQSYRVASDKIDEDSVATAFARSFCEGIGWDLIKDRSVSLKADTDRDRSVSFTEIVCYTRRRCTYYLASSGSEQTVYCYPEVSSFTLASRSD